MLLSTLAARERLVGSHGREDYVRSSISNPKTEDNMPNALAVSRLLTPTETECRLYLAGGPMERNRVIGLADQKHVGAHGKHRTPMLGAQRTFLVV